MKERGDVRKQPTQTTPKGAEIPVPKRGDFMRDLRKAATPEPPKASRKARFACTCAHAY
jgi:hypothetical protein